jgi:hypothetical protein
VLDCVAEYGRYLGAEMAQGKLLATISGGETIYEERFPAEGPSLLPRKGVFVLDFRSADSWPLSITWEIEQTLDGSPSGSISLLAAALSPTTQ